MAFSLRLFLISWLLFATNAIADVMHSAEDGFEIKSSISVPATPEQAYRQFLKVNEWWSPEHTWWGSADALSIEPRAGGCFCETDGDKSVLHSTVAFVSPNREIRLLGGLGPLQQIGLQGVLTYKFIPESDNETRIVQIYRVSGYDPNGLKKLAVFVDQVQSLQLNRLKSRFKSRF